MLSLVSVNMLNQQSPYNNHTRTTLFQMINEPNFVEIIWNKKNKTFKLYEVPGLIVRFLLGSYHMY